MHQRTWLSLLTLPIVAAFSYPVVFQRAQPAPRVEAAKSPQDPLSGLSDIQDVLTLVRDNYVDTPDLEKVIAGGIENALERAHPLNAYLTPEELRLPDPGPAQVGLPVLKKTIWAQVVAVTPGSPADQAGVQVGDVIRKLDGDSIGAMSAWQLERKLKGPLGSQLNLVNYDSVSGQLKKLGLTRELVKRPGIARAQGTQGHPGHPAGPLRRSRRRAEGPSDQPRSRGAPGPRPARLRRGGAHRSQPGGGPASLGAGPS